MSPPLHEALGARLADLRARRGWTVEAVAIATAVPAEDIQRHEAGAPIPVDRLWRFAKALRVPLSAFFVDGQPLGRAVTPTIAGAEEGVALLKAFRSIGDAHLRAVLIDIAEHFGGCSDA